MSIEKMRLNAAFWQHSVYEHKISLMLSMSTVKSHFTGLRINFDFNTQFSLTHCSFVFASISDSQ